MADGQMQTPSVEEPAQETKAQADVPTALTAAAQTAQSDTTDWKAEARKWEARAKENKAKADAYDEAEEAAKSDLQKAIERAEKAEKQVADYEAEKARVAAVKAVAASVGVDFELLSLMSGSTQEEIEANAATLKAKLDAQQKYPAVADEGEKKTPATKSGDIPKLI